MKRISNNLAALPHFGRISLVLLLACLVISTREAGADSLRYRGGLRNGPGPRALSEKELALVLKSLQEKTGFLELGFDEYGFLTIGDKTRFSGGSQAARELIAAATEAILAIDLESHNHSTRVAFARQACPTIYYNRMTGEKIDVYPVELDFSDFSTLRGDRQVLAAFDIGFVILHELGHAVLKLHDAVDEGSGPGECEDYVNRVRRELNLPVRMNYVAKLFQMRNRASQLPIEEAELTFTDPDRAMSGRRPKLFSLNWEAARVGPVRQAALAPSIARSSGPRTISASIGGQ